MKYELTISGENYAKIKAHLFPGDGNESVLIALCGICVTSSLTRLLVHKLILIPYDKCVRKPDLVSWKTEIIDKYLDEAVQENLAILKIHCHPTGYPEFSIVDDESDKEFFDSIYAWLNNKIPHISAIMLPNGEIFGRVVTIDKKFIPLHKITVVGSDVNYWFSNNTLLELDDFALRNTQVLGGKTTNLLKKLKIGIVGCSGTGSPLIMQLARLGVGELVLIDPDVVDKTNLNRIAGSKLKDAIDKKFKTDVLKEYIDSIGLGTIVHSFNVNLYNDIFVLKELSSCDFLFGCMDSVDGRHLLNQLATFYLIPYLDLGVGLESDGIGGIDEISGAVHYIQPELSSLLSRKAYSSEELSAANLLRTDKKEYESQKRLKYIKDVDVLRPAIVSINNMISSTAVNDFLARIHYFRYENNKMYAATRVDICEWEITKEKESDFPIDIHLAKNAGRGDINPLLGMTCFSL
jgi:hypothetical protein